jgi:class 3 adenylate cyclase
VLVRKKNALSGWSPRSTLKIAHSAMGLPKLLLLLFLPAILAVSVFSTQTGRSLENTVNTHVLNFLNPVPTRELSASTAPGAFSIFICGFLGGALGVLLPNFWFWAPFALGLVLIPVGGLALFTFASMQWPWLFALIAFAVSGAVAWTECHRKMEQYVSKIRNALTGLVPQERLKGFLKKPWTLVSEPSARVVTVMFVDIVGFSTNVESQTPKETFLILKEMMSHVSDTILKHGGIVDKTIGDGLLAFFGYNYDGIDPIQNHANSALYCAIEIQEWCLKKALQASIDRAPIHPIRIGINTTAVYVGDIGNSNKINFTFIGHGVSFAKRLESACENFSVLLGATSKDMLLHAGTRQVPLRKRLIQIKRHTQLVEAYECDPFSLRPELRSKAIIAYRAYLKRERKDPRWPVPPGISVTVKGETFAGTLVNFSESGIAVILNEYLGSDVIITFSLDSDKSDLKGDLANLGLLLLTGEVRWAKATGDQYETGIAIKNLNEDQRRNFLTKMLAHLGEELPKIVNG